MKSLAPLLVSGSSSHRIISLYKRGWGRGDRVEAASQERSNLLSKRKAAAPASSPPAGGLVCSHELRWKWQGDDPVQGVQRVPERDPRRARHPVRAVQLRDAHPAGRPDPGGGAAGARAGGVPARPRQEARRADRHHVRRHAPGLRRPAGPRERRQVHEEPPLPALRLPRRVRHHAHRRPEGPVPAADQGEHPDGDALAGAGVQLRRLPGVPLLRAGRAGGRRRRRRGGRVRRGHLPAGRVPERAHPGRRDQRGHRAPAGARRQAARRGGRVLQRHGPGPPLRVPHVPERVLAVGGREPPVGRLEGHQRRPRRAHQRLQRGQEQFRHDAGRLRVGGRHDAQLHPGAGVRAARGHLRPPAHLHESHHEEPRRGTQSAGAHRRTHPHGGQLQRRAGAEPVLLGDV